MKKPIIYVSLLLMPILWVAQNKEKVGIIKKDKKGAIYSVKFPSSIEKR